MEDWTSLKKVITEPNSCKKSVAMVSHIVDMITYSSIELGEYCK